MSTPKLAIANKFTSFNKNSVYVIPVTKKAEKLVIGASGIETSALAQLDLASVGASASLESVVRVPGPAGATYALMGVGNQPLSLNDYRNLGGAAVRALSSFKDIVLGFETKDAAEAAAVLEGASLGGYTHNKYKGLLKGAESKVQSVTLISAFKPTPASMNQISVVADSVNLTRDLVNMPARDLYPETLAKFVTNAAKGSGVSVQV
ncbi:MAG: hypothetical protein RL140_502, partial [Actinomycetota bacterium]